MVMCKLKKQVRLFSYCLPGATGREFEGNFPTADQENRNRQSVTFAINVIENNALQPTKHITITSSVYNLQCKK